jgi:glycosyltransferase involved in cell wall biosynthesis
MSALNIHFHRPPEALRIGGLDLAIHEMAGSLRTQGANVLFIDETASSNQTASGRTIGWFHGLWQPSYRRWAHFYSKSKIPYAVSPHGMLEPWAMKNKAWKKIPYFILMEKGWLSSASIIFSTGSLESQSIRRWLPGQRIEEIALGLAADKAPDYQKARNQLQWADHDVVLLYLSRIHPKKGLLELIRALTHLTEQQRACVRLVIVGDGPKPYTTRIRSFIDRNKSQLPRIDQVGPVWGEEKWAYLQGADLFCLPTYSENFGLAVLEALRVGTPVFTTDQTPWGGFSERNGFYITSPGQMAITRGVCQAIKEYQWGPEARAELSDWSGKAFNWDIIGSQYIQLLDSCSARTL